MEKQEVMRKDNASCYINRVLFFKIYNATKAVLEAKDFEFVIYQLVQTS